MIQIGLGEEFNLVVIQPVWIVADHACAFHVLVVLLEVLVSFSLL